MLEKASCCFRVGSAHQQQGRVADCLLHGVTMVNFWTLEWAGIFSRITMESLSFLSRFSRLERHCPSTVHRTIVQPTPSSRTVASSLACVLSCHPSRLPVGSSSATFPAACVDNSRNKQYQQEYSAYKHHASILRRLLQHLSDTR